jgi:lysozyme
MTIDDYMKALELDEGFRGRPYYCPSDALSIMYGRNLDANPFTEEEGRFILGRDVRRIEAEMSAFFGPDLWNTIGDWRRVALVNMRYQLGRSGFRGFRKMISAVRAKDWKMAAAEAADSKWADQTVLRSERVVTALADNVNTWS